MRVLLIFAVLWSTAASATDCRAVQEALDGGATARWLEYRYREAGDRMGLRCLGIDPDAPSEWDASPKATPAEAPPAEAPPVDVPPVGAALVEVAPAARQAELEPPGPPGLPDPRRLGPAKPRELPDFDRDAWRLTEQPALEAPRKRRLEEGWATPWYQRGQFVRAAGSDYRVRAIDLAAELGDDATIEQLTRLRSQQAVGVGLISVGSGMMIGGTVLAVAGVIVTLTEFVDCLLSLGGSCTSFGPQMFMTGAIVTVGGTVLTVAGSIATAEYRRRKWRVYAYYTPAQVAEGIRRHNARVELRGRF